MSSSNPLRFLVRSYWMALSLHRCNFFHCTFRRRLRNQKVNVRHKEIFRKYPNMNIFFAIFFNLYYSFLLLEKGRAKGSVNQHAPCIRYKEKIFVKIFWLILDSTGKLFVGHLVWLQKSIQKTRGYMSESSMAKLECFFGTISFHAKQIVP